MAVTGAHERNIQRQDGVALIAVLLTTTLLLGLVMAGMSLTQARNQHLLSEIRQYRALLAAESGLDVAVRRAGVGGLDHLETIDGDLGGGSTYQIAAFSFQEDGIDNDADEVVDEADENALQVTVQGRFGSARHTLRGYMTASIEEFEFDAGVTLLGVPRVEIGGDAEVSGLDSRRGDEGDAPGLGVVPPGDLNDLRRNLSVTGSAELNGSPQIAETEAPFVLDEVVAMMRAAADTHLAEEHVSVNELGTEDSPSIVFRDGDLALTSTTGFGVLVVTGDLSLAGNFSWRGLVIVLGDFRAAGTAEIDGAMVVGPDASIVDLTGTADIRYSGDGLTFIPRNRYGSLQRWHEAAQSAMGPPR